MSPDKSNSKGKAVLVKEEPSSPPVVHLDDEPEILVAIPLEKGSSSLAPSNDSVTYPASQGAGATTLVALPLSFPGTQQQSGDHRSVTVKHIIMQCVIALGMGNVAAADTALQHLSSVAAAASDASQRAALLFAEALAYRAVQLLPGVARALQLQAPPLLTTRATTGLIRPTLATVYPLLGVAARAANRAILEATAADHAVHVVDLGGAGPNQWRNLIRRFAVRPGGPPYLRLTVVNDQDLYLARMARMTCEEAVLLHVPFAFNPVRAHVDSFTPSNVAALSVAHGKGEALVITSMLQIHRLIAEEVTIELRAHENSIVGHTTSHLITRADALLRVLRDLKPKLMVLIEQEADHNSSDLSHRVPRAFDHYTVLFQDIEAALPSGNPNLGALEHVIFREEVLDIVAGEGVLRRERHETFERWALRMKVAGFLPTPISFDIFKEAKEMASQMSGGAGQCLYGARKVDKGCFFLYSRKVPMFSVSIWRGPCDALTSQAVWLGKK